MLPPSGRVCNCSACQYCMDKLFAIEKKNLSYCEIFFQQLIILHVIIYNNNNHFPPCGLQRNYEN